MIAIRHKTNNKKKKTESDASSPLQRAAHMRSKPQKEEKQQQRDIMAISGECVEDLIGTFRESLKAQGFETYPFKVICPTPLTR